MGIPSTPSSPNDAAILPHALWRNDANSHFLAKMERDSFTNVPVHSIEEAVRQAQKWSESGVDVYFACAEYASHTSRKADNVIAVRGFWLDIDCGEKKATAGKGYANPDIAEGELSKFCAETGIPEPTHVVNSGGGLHVYWILKEKLDPTAWKSTAEKLKQVIAARGFLADPSRTADTASVLRLPDTLNHKYDPPRPVNLTVSSSEYIETDAFCRAVHEAHAQSCPIPIALQSRDMVAIDPPHGAPDLDRLRTALATQDPDCDEKTWKLHRIAPLARAARDYPDLEEPLRNLTVEWSSGVLRGTPSTKWCEPGGNGQTGEEIFDQVWNRFLQEEDRMGPMTTLGTIFHDAKLAGGPTDVLPAEPLSHLQSRYGLILQGGDLYGVRLIDGDPQQLFVKERTLRRLMRRDLKKRFPGHDPGPIVKEFFDSPRTKLILGVYLHPTQERPGYLNLWRGSVLEPQPGDCSLIKEFLLHVICGGDQVLYGYLLNYLAHMLQRPEEKPGVIIILIGGQGIGKGTFGYLLRRIFGDGYLHVGRIETVLGNFNGALERSYIVFLDEAFFHGDRRHTEALKSLVTEPTVTINEKHQPTRQVESFHRFIIATNAEHVKHTDSDDRRDLVFRVSDRHKQDTAYFRSLYAEIDGDGAAALMQELLERDISNFDVRRRPVTSALIDQRVQSLDDVGRWWHQCLQEGGIGDLEGDWPEFLSTDEVLRLVEEYAGVRRHRKLTRQAIVRHLPKLCPSITQAQRRLPSRQRPRGLALPSLEIARNEFEHYMGGEVPW